MLLLSHKRISDPGQNVCIGVWRLQDRTLWMFVVIISLARTPEIGQGLGRIISCGARKPEQT